VLARDPVLYYEVYVNLPGDGKDAQYTSPSYAGNLTFFDLTMPSAHQMSRGLAQQINLTRVYAYQRSRGAAERRRPALSAALRTCGAGGPAAA
jgi:hypothetical protein